MLEEKESNMEMINEVEITTPEVAVYESEENLFVVDYDSLPVDKLIAELAKFDTKEIILAHRNEIEAIKKAFYNHFNDALQNSDSESDENLALKDILFKQKADFESKFGAIKDIQKKHFKNVEADLKTNLEERLAIIEGLKDLIKPENTVTNKFAAFNTLRERWRNAGACPKDKYNHVWNNYHFHVENLFDYIHLDKEARDLEFKHNYDKKIELLQRLEILLGESDAQKSLSAIRLIQKVWREDIGPVERHKREELWAKFDALNEKVNELKKQVKAALSEEEKDNFNKKTEIINQIGLLTTEPKNSVDFWNKQSENLNALKEGFLKIGRAPRDVNEQLWSDFRSALKQFNEQKNNYFKKLREEQNSNIEKKKALVEKAKALENSENVSSTDIVKQLQEEWKKIGHVPSKFSNPLWFEFKAACDNYFNRLHERKNAENQVEVEAFTKKEAFLKVIESTVLSGVIKDDIAAIQSLVKEWNEIGRVPFSKKNIQDTFNKAIDALYGTLKMERTALELLQFKSGIERIVASGDFRKLNDEEIYLSKKITEIKTEINQLENNILFFSNAKKDNPFVLEVKKNIEKHKDNLEKWNQKLKIVRASR